MILSLLGGGNDTVNPGFGNDVVDGGTGIDVLILDYTLNIYDGLVSSIASNGSGGFNGNYSANYTFGGTDKVTFSNIERFQLTGTSKSDTIVTGNGNDTINGGTGNDTINGGAGNDLLTGVNPNGLNPGIGEKDIFSGGAGGDSFILGDSTWIGYDDGLTNNAGTNDYADIADFNPTQGDIIQLKGGISYLLNTVGTDTQLLIDKPNTEPDELIGIIRNRTGLNLTSNSFFYASFSTITLAVSPASVTENGTNNLVYTFTRTGATTSALTVNYSIAGTADSTDYTGATPGTGKSINFAANSVTATLTIDPTADTTIENDETVALSLAIGTTYNVGTTAAVTGTITNDDFPSLSINDISVVEGKDSNAYLTVNLSSPVNQAITVNYTTTPIDATANVDYTSKTGTLTIAPNSSFATLSIPILNDNLNEADEAFLVTLSSPGNAILDPNTSVGEVIITDTLQSSISRTLPANVENLKLNGVAAINGTGNALNNIILGNGVNNILTGAAGKDTLIGDLGNDRFGYKILTDSLLANFDVIKDFNANANNDLFLVTTARTGFTNAGTATTLDNAGITAKLTTANFGANSAAQFTFGSRSFVAINNATAGFSQTTDAIIEITGFTGTLGLTNFVTV